MRSCSEGAGAAASVAKLVDTGKALATNVNGPLAVSGSVCPKALRTSVLALSAIRTTSFVDAMK